MIHLKKDSFYIYALIGICLVFLLLKLWFLNPKVVWDESVYLGMGKYIYSSGESGLWEMIRPLGLPLITGLFWKLGMDQIIVSRIFSILISLGCIILTYLIAKELFDKNHALLSATIIACTPIIFLYSDYILTDHISTLFLMLSILLLLKDRYIYAGIFGGLAFWFKFTHVLYIFALLIFIGYKYIIRNKFLDSRKTDKKTVKIFLKNMDTRKYIFTVAIIILVVATYFLSNYFIYKEHYGFIDAIIKPYITAASYSDNPYQNMIFNGAPLSYIFYYPHNIIFNHTYGFLIYIFFLIYFIMFIKFNNEFVKKESHVVMMFIFLTYLVYFSIIAYKVNRFWITFLPFMAIYSAYGILWLVEHNRFGKRNQRKQNNYVKFISIIIVIILFGLVLYKDVQLFKQNRSNTIYYASNPAAQRLLDVEKYFDTQKIDGPILVTDPLFAAYSDKKYVGAYDVLNDDGLFVNDWESNDDIDSFNAAAYIDSSIPCRLTDTKCMTNKEKLKDLIKNNFKETASYEYNGENVTFYIK